MTVLPVFLDVPMEVRPLPPRGTVMAEPFPPESIHQRFAYGLRFVTELEYRVKGANGRRKYRRLLDEPSPLVPHPGDAGGGWTCAALGVAVLLEAEVEPLDGLAAQEAQEEQEEQGVEQIADVLSRLLPDYRVRVHGPQLLPYWGGIAHSTLAGKGIGLAQLVVKSQVRWSLVVGSQWCTAYGFPITQRPPGFAPQGYRDSLDVGKRDIPSRTLHRRNIGPIEFALEREPFLRPAFFYPKQPNPVAEHVSDVLRIGQFGGGSWLGRHRKRMRV